MTWKTSSKTQNCPVCGRDHDDNCSWTFDALTQIETVLCRTKANPNSKVTQPADRTSDGYEWNGKIDEKGILPRAIYVRSAKDKMKAGYANNSNNNGNGKGFGANANKITHYYYGKRLARVCRWDTGNGKKQIWQEYWLEDKRLAKHWKDGCFVSISENKVKEGKATQEERKLYLELVKPIQAQLHLYRIDDLVVQKAIAQQLPLLIVEGEGLVDLLIDEFQIAATCPIGGAGKWKHYGCANYLEDLANCLNLVICPDRDRAGIDHGLSIYADLEMAQWLYADPTSAGWENPIDGYDLKNWIIDMKRSGLNQHQIVNQIVGAIEKKPRNFTSVDTLNLKVDTGVYGTQPLLGKSYKNTVDTVDTVDKAKDDGSCSLRDRVAEILNKYHAASLREVSYIELSNQIGTSATEIRKLAKVLQEEIDLREERAENKSEVEKIIYWRNQHFSTYDYLHPGLAEHIEQTADWMGIEPARLLTVLLPTAASLLSVHSRVIVRECIDFIEPLVFYAGISTESGNRKSPTIKAITKPLKVFQALEDDRYTAETEQYQEDLYQHKKRSNNKDSEESREPEPPKKPREFFVDNITSEALDRIKGQQPTKGLLIRKDELSGLFGMQNAYRGGKGADKEGLLSGWGGDGIKVNRAGGGRISVSDDATSIVGAIQPAKLRKLMGDFEDEQGEWARFLWYSSPLRLYELPDEDTHYELGEVLRLIYQAIDELEPVRYRFAPEAFKVYKQWHLTLQRRKLAEPRAGVRAMLAKFEGYTARIAGILHILHEVCQGAIPAEEISVEQTNAAIKLAQFYIDQAMALHSEKDEAEGALPPILAKILEKCATSSDGRVTARALKQSIRALKKVDPDKIRDYFGELVSMGHGEVEGVGNRATFRLSTASTVSTLSIQSQSDKAFQPVDADVYFETKTVNTLASHLQLPNKIISEEPPVFSLKVDAGEQERVAEAKTQIAVPEIEPSVPAIEAIEQSSFFDEPLKRWHQGQRVMAWRGTLNQWVEATIKSVEINASGCFKCLVSFVTGGDQYCWQEDWLDPIH